MRLRLLALACFAGSAIVTPAAAQDRPTAAQEADMKEMQGYRLTAATFAKLGKVQDNMYLTLKAHPELAKKYAAEREEEGQPQTFDEMAKRFDRVPEMKQAIVTAGLTPREYMVAMMALFQAAMAEAVLQMPGADRSKLGPSVQANMAFLKAHQAEMNQFQARGREIEKLTRQATGEPDDEETGEPDAPPR